MLNSMQIRAARGALKISALELSDITGLSRQTIQNLENDQDSLERASLKTVKKIKEALEERGAVFLRSKRNNDIIIAVGMIAGDEIEDPS